MLFPAGKFTYTDRRKAKVNTKEKRKTVKKEKKNFIQKNAVENIMKGDTNIVRRTVSQGFADAFL